VLHESGETLVRLSDKVSALLWELISS
jgi:hypothetical protein